MIEKNYISNLPQIPFRTGIGCYEGIVYHSTDNLNDSVESERNYESTTFRKAFVQAFSDKNRTLEVASPNYISYGAGEVANYRYLNSELCEVPNDGSETALADFKASYANWIDYAATKLYERKLGVTAAQPDGSGTCWQHKNVTDWLGGTTHTDPMEYLSTWNVTWEQVIADTKLKYEELEQMDAILKQLADLQAQVKGLGDSAVKIAAPQWFVDEFKSADLGGLIKEPSKSIEFWETTAVILRAVKYVA